MNINKYLCTGRLTKDPELRALPNGTSVCALRVAVDGLGRQNEPGFIDVTVYGASADSCAQYLKKGAKVAVDGRLEYREWDGKDGKRHDYGVVANTVEFLDSRATDNRSAKPEPVAA
jgi:single-strand DNA-binding protein